MSKPILKVKDYPFEIVFFENVYQDGAKSMSAVLSRSYKTKNGEYKSETVNIFPDSLLKISNITSKAYNTFNQYRNKVREEAKENKDNTNNINNNIDSDIPF